jgi:transcriptional regulator with XRE-family HTH domain
MSEIIAETINHRIRLVRQALEMTQVNFSRVLSLSTGFLAGVETERRRVNGRIIKLMCSSFNVNEQWLKTGEGEMFIQSADEMFSKLVSLFKELKPEYRNFIIKQINLLLDIQDNKTLK